MIRRIFFFLIAASLASLAAWANPEDDDYSRIARLSYLEGQVSFQHASDTDWLAASINFPMQPGDRVFTGSNGKAEIEFDDGSVFRLAENTDIELLSLRDDLIQLRIFSGLSTLAASGKMEFEVDTPAAAFNTLRRGLYRFDVVENGDTDAIVREGELEAANNRFSRRIRQGELLHVESGERGLENLSRYTGRDRWDDWTDRRDMEANTYRGGRYLPSTVRVGASELGRYGRWVEVASYGSAWVPLHVDVSWSPYSVGRWCYRPFWGWTWVSYEPWGWLPYHYGRWYRDSRIGWCWLPGPAYTFNFWSPGLAVFYQGSGWVSWGPLGPGDYYNIDRYYYNRRLYGHYLGQLRSLHTRGPNDPFNRRVQGAFRTVDDDHFRNGVFGDRDRSPRWRNVDQPWSSGSLVRDRINIRPTVASHSANPTRPGLRPARANSLPAVVRSAPASRGGNHSRVTTIATPRGYSGINRQNPSGSRGERPEIRQNTNDRISQPQSGSSNQGSDRRNPPNQGSDRQEIRTRTNDSSSGNREPQAESSNQGSARQNPSSQRSERPAQPRTNERSRDNTVAPPQSGSPDRRNDGQNQSDRPNERKAQPRNNQSSQSNRSIQPQLGISDQGNVRQNPRTYQIPQTQYVQPRTTYVSPYKQSQSSNSDSGEVRSYSNRRTETPADAVRSSNTNNYSRVDTSRFSSGGSNSGQAVRRSDQGSSVGRSGGGENRNSESRNSSGGGQARSRR